MPRRRRSSSVGGWRWSSSGSGWRWSKTAIKGRWRCPRRLLRRSTPPFYAGGGQSASVLPQRAGPVGQRAAPTAPKGPGYCRCAATSMPWYFSAGYWREVPKSPPLRIPLGINARGSGRSLQLPRGLARAAVATGLAGSLGVPIAVGDGCVIPIANQTAHTPVTSYTADSVAVDNTVSRVTVSRQTANISPSSHTPRGITSSDCAPVGTDQAANIATLAGHDASSVASSDCAPGWNRPGRQQTRPRQSRCRWRSYQQFRRN